MATLKVQTASGLAIVGGVSQGAPAPPASGIFPVSYEFFGPFPDGGLVPQGTAGAYGWAEDATSASIQVLNIDQGVPSDWATALFAEWRLVWLPANASNGVRLVHADSGPSNITQIAEFTGNAGGTPTNTAVDVTADLNALVAAGVWKQLGMQVKQAGGLTIYQSRLEVVWQIGG